MVNWKVRIKNPHFWLTAIPAAILLAQTVMAAFGLTVDLTDIQGKLLAIVDAVFALLAVLGVVNDPTTATLADSERALTYDEPAR